MKTTGEKIQALRLALGISQEQLAIFTGVTAKSIHRYEAGKSIPDTFNIAKLADFFGVSIDYLLGHVGLREEKEVERYMLNNFGTYNWLYKKYITSRETVEFDSQEDYYWIHLYKNDGKPDYGGHTSWCGWADDNCEVEIRRLTAVDPMIAYEMCCQLNDKPMIINSEHEAYIFFLFGGNAIVKKSICQQFLPGFCKDFYHINPNKKYRL